MSFADENVTQGLPKRGVDTVELVGGEATQLTGMGPSERADHGEGRLCGMHGTEGNLVVTRGRDVEVSSFSSVRTSERVSGGE